MPREMLVLKHYIIQTKALAAVLALRWWMENSFTNTHGVALIVASTTTKVKGRFSSRREEGTSCSERKVGEGSCTGLSSSGENTEKEKHCT